MTSAFYGGMHRAGKWVLDLCFPPRCPISHEPVERAGMVAPKIWAQMDFIGAPFCAGCGIPFEYQIDGQAGIKCADCLAHPPLYSRARAALVYDDLSRDLILGFKHGDQMQSVRTFIPWLKQAGAELLNDADYIVPVPLHYVRLIKRRYNQAAILGQYLARETGVPVLVDGLKRVRHTSPQGNMDARARSKNVRKAFAVNDKYSDNLKGKNIVLIDDVLTTGATVNECAKVLKNKAGAARIDVLTIARVAMD